MNTFGHFVSFVWADIVLCCFGLLCNVFVLILTLFRVFSHVKLFVHSEALLLKESADIFPFPRLLRLPCQCKIWGRTFCFRLRSRSCNFFFFFFFCEFVVTADYFPKMLVQPRMKRPSEEIQSTSHTSWRCSQPSATSLGMPNKAQKCVSPLTEGGCLAISVLCT